VSPRIVRRAGVADARGIADLLRDVLADADTSALAGPPDAATVRKWMASAPERAAWHVAEAEDGTTLGVQWIEPLDALPPDMADIATFVAPGRQRIGTGSALFAKTVDAARALGYRWLQAVIRADNEGGLVYYRSRGFEPVGRITDRQLADGRRIDRIAMRYDLA
jgi:L-amino acid N-acyltransferase YncA